MANASPTSWILDHTNAYAQSLDKDGITRTLAIVQLTAPRVDLAPLKEFRVEDHSMVVHTDAEDTVEDLVGHLMKQFWPSVAGLS